MKWRLIKSFSDIYHASKYSPDMLEKFCRNNRFVYWGNGAWCDFNLPYADLVNKFKYYEERLKEAKSPDGIIYGKDNIYLNYKWTNPPYQDHMRLFKDNYGDGCITYHTYEPMGESMEQDIKQWANEWELQAAVYPSQYSWYYPGHSTLVIISKNIDTIKL